MKRAKRRDPSNEPYPSPWSEAERGTLSPQEHLAELERASRKAALARDHNERGTFNSFVDPARSEASATATVGVSLDFLREELRYGAAAKKARRDGGYGAHKETREEREERDDAICAEYTRRLKAGERERSLVRKITQMMGKPETSLSDFNLDARQVRRITDKCKK